jgi:hypothetical protein
VVEDNCCKKVIHWNTISICIIETPIERLLYCLGCNYRANIPLAVDVCIYIYTANSLDKYMISIMTGTYVKNGRFLNGEKCSRTLIKDLFNAAFETSCIYNIFKGITS